MKLKIELERWLTEHLKKINMSDREMMDAKNGISERKSYGFRDPVVRKVCDKFIDRSNVGYEKYGSTLDDERRLKMKGLQKYLNDIQEELMDAVLYIQSARDELQDLSEESLIHKFNDDEYEERISQE
jgi:hypothetical protein